MDVSVYRQKPPMGSYADRSHPLCPTWAYMFNERGGTVINDIVQQNNGIATEVSLGRGWNDGPGWTFNNTHDDGDKVTIDDAIVSGPPFSVFARWKLKRALSTTGSAIWSVSNDSSSSEQHALIVGGSQVPTNDTCSAMSRDTGWEDAEGTTVITVNEWNTCCGVWRATNDRRIYTNGEDEAINTGTKDPNDLNTMQIGLLSDSSPNWEFGGDNGLCLHLQYQGFIGWRSLAVKSRSICLGD